MKDVPENINNINRKLSLIQEPYADVSSDNESLLTLLNASLLQWSQLKVPNMTEIINVKSKNKPDINQIYGQDILNDISIYASQFNLPKKKCKSKRERDNLEAKEDEESPKIKTKKKKHKLQELSDNESKCEEPTAKGSSHKKKKTRDLDNFKLPDKRQYQTDKGNCVDNKFSLSKKKLKGEEGHLKDSEILEKVKNKKKSKHQEFSDNEGKHGDPTDKESFERDLKRKKTKHLDCFEIADKKQDKLEKGKYSISEFILPKEKSKRERGHLEVDEMCEKNKNKKKKHNLQESSDNESKCGEPTAKESRHKKKKTRDLDNFKLPETRQYQTDDGNCVDNKFSLSKKKSKGEEDHLKDSEILEKVKNKKKKSKHQEFSDNEGKHGDPTDKESFERDLERKKTKYPDCFEIAEKQDKLEKGKFAISEFILPKKKSKRERGNLEVDEMFEKNKNKKKKQNHQEYSDSEIMNIGEEEKKRKKTKISSDSKHENYEIIHNRINQSSTSTTYHEESKKKSTKKQVTKAVEVVKDPSKSFGDEQLNNLEMIDDLIQKTVAAEGESINKGEDDASSSDGEISLKDDSVLNNNNFSQYLDDLKEKREYDYTAMNNLKHLSILIPWVLPVAHTIEKRVGAQGQRELFKTLNMKYRMYSKEEDDHIKKNWEEFCRTHDLKVQPQIFFPYYGGQMNLLPQNEKLNFARYLGKNLPHRTLTSIYRRFQSLFVEGKKGKFTLEEDMVILNFMNDSTSKHKYSELAEILSRGKEFIKKRYSRLKYYESQQQEHTITWTFELMGSLVKNLLEVTEVSSIEQLRDFKTEAGHWAMMGQIMNIPISKIRTKWERYIYPGLFLEESNNLNDIREKTVDILYESNITDSKNIVWNDVALHFKGLTGTKLNRLFHFHVQSRCPSLRPKFRECITFLKNDVKHVNRPFFKRLIYEEGKLCHKT